jgi:hypothetical protein
MAVEEMMFGFNLSKIKESWNDWIFRCFQIQKVKYFGAKL